MRTPHVGRTGFDPASKLRRHHRTGRKTGRGNVCRMCDALEGTMFDVCFDGWSGYVPSHDDVERFVYLHAFLLCATRPVSTFALIHLWSVGCSHRMLELECNMFMLEASQCFACDVHDDQMCSQPRRGLHGMHRHVDRRPGNDHASSFLQLQTAAATKHSTSLLYSGIWGGD